jgi:class 3 adenylate cyclase
VAASLAASSSLETLWSHPSERKRLLQWLRREKDFRGLVFLENVCEQLRQWFRQNLGIRAEAEILGCLGSERFLEDLVLDGGARGRFLKQLKLRHKELLPAARTALREAQKFVRRGQKQWLGRLSQADLAAALYPALKQWTKFLAVWEDAQTLSVRFARGQRSETGETGFKLWRGCELVYTATPGPGHDRLKGVPQWEKLKQDLDNAFAEGNLFLCRTRGDIYPGERERRQQSTFLFADLRNSTETTMKLTKDTASYLTPYLTAVDTEAQACQGERIYFAGDGYAAHYQHSADAIRAAYNLAGRFVQLRSQATEEHRRRVKAIYKEAQALKLPWLKPRTLEKSLGSIKAVTVSAEAQNFLRELAAQPTESISEETLMKVLIKLASDYCMPRVEVGVGLTSGELFQAMVGAEDRPKYPIVISPALTQAARLSGSSDIVKKYIEEKLPQPFPFHAHAWDQKLFNRGIVITDEVFEKLKTEVHIKNIEHKIKIFEKEKFLYYYDTRLNKRLILRDIHETIVLKGISRPCHIYEIILPYSVTDKLFGTAEE